jgi:hypothetical protein
VQPYAANNPNPKNNPHAFACPSRTASAGEVIRTAMNGAAKKARIALSTLCRADYQAKCNTFKKKAVR